MPAAIRAFLVSLTEGKFSRERAKLVLACPCLRCAALHCTAPHTAPPSPSDKSPVESSQVGWSLESLGYNPSYPRTVPISLFPAGKTSIAKQKAPYMHLIKQRLQRIVE